MNNNISTIRLLKGGITEEFISSLSTNQQKALSVISLVENGELFLSQENLLSHQNTTVENIPHLLYDFMKDINLSYKTFKEILFEVKSIGCLHTEMLFDKYSISLDAQNEVILCQNVKIELQKHIDTVVYYSKIIESHLKDELLNFTIDVGGKKKALLESIKKFIHPLTVKIETTYGANTSSGNLYSVGLIKTAICNKETRALFEKMAIKNDVNELKEAASYFLDSKSDSAFLNVYNSMNYIDEGLLPKTAYHFQTDPKENISFDIIALKVTPESKKKLSYNYFDWEISEDFEFYYKKLLIEKVTQHDFVSFMAYYKDYQINDNHFLECKIDSTKYDEKHPIIIATKKQIQLDGLLRKHKVSYYKDIEILLKELSYNEKKELTQKWDIFSWTKELGIDGGKEYSSSEIFRLLNKRYYELIANEFLDYYPYQSKEFLTMIDKKIFIEKSMNSILNYVYNESQIEESVINSKSAILYSFQKRATFHTILKESYIVDIRDKLDPYINDVAQKMIIENKEFERLNSALNAHPYIDFIEIDNDIEKKDSIVNFSHIAKLLEGSKLLNLPVRYRCGMKFRKLKNYKAKAIYFNHSKTLGMDYRKDNCGLKSFIHETSHHIDLNGDFPQRYSMVSILKGYFKKRIHERIDYFLKPEELIARAAEISLLLIASDYKHQRDMHKDSNILKAALKEKYENSKYRDFMKSWEEYNNSDEYISIEKCIDGEDYSGILEVITPYFKAFWEGKLYEDETLLKSLSKGDFKTFHPINKISYSYTHCRINGINDTEIDEDYMIDSITSFLHKIKPQPVLYNKEEKEEMEIVIKKLLMRYLEGDKKVLSKYDRDIFMTKKMASQIEHSYAVKFNTNKNFSENIEKVREFLGSIRQL